MSSPNREIVGDYFSEIDVGPPLFTPLQLESIIDGAENVPCDQPLATKPVQNIAMCNVGLKISLFGTSSSHGHSYILSLI